MKREPRAVWVERVEQYRQSGMSTQAFAESIGVNVNTLRSWHYLLAREERESKAARTTSKPEFVEVVPANGVVDDKFDVVLPSGACVRVPPSFDAVVLKRLVAALESR